MKKILLPTINSLLLFLISANSYGQSLSNEDIKAQMVKEWERAKAYTNEYLNTMPPEKYSFKAQDSIRSFAQQMLHLANGNVFLMSNATGQATPSWFGFNTEKSAGAQKKDSVVYYVNSSYDYCINAVKNTDLNKWGETKKIFGRDATTFALMLKTFEHQTHHRGQTTIYIRTAGYVPPQEKLF